MTQEEPCANCGHEEHWHQLVKPKICLENTCPCKKFIPQNTIVKMANTFADEVLKPQNHSPQGINFEEKSKIFCPSLEGKKPEVCGHVSSSGSDSLSDKIREIIERKGSGVINFKKEDLIKELIKSLGIN